GRERIGDRHDARADANGKLARETIMGVWASEYPPASVQVEQSRRWLADAFGHVKTRHDGPPSTWYVEVASLGHDGPSVIERCADHGVGGEAGLLRRELPERRSALGFQGLQQCDELGDLGIHSAVLFSISRLDTIAAV